MKSSQTSSIRNRPWRLFAVLGAVIYAVVAYWDKVMELVCKMKSLVSGRSDDDMEDMEFADWEE